LTLLQPRKKKPVVVSMLNRGEPPWHWVALAKVNDADLGGKVKLFGPRDFTRAEAMFITVDDWADHYSQLANYLRLNGQVPPTAKEKEE
jgi:hypothetical protein